MVANGVVVTGLDLMWRCIDGLFVVAYWVVVWGVDFNVEVDGFSLVAYGVVVCRVDCNVEVDGLCVIIYRVVVCGVGFNVELMVCFWWHRGWWSVGKTFM